MLLQTNAANWNTFAEKCQTLQTQVTTAQKQIDDVKKVGKMFSPLPLNFLSSVVRDDRGKGRPQGASGPSNRDQESDQQNLRRCPRCQYHPSGLQPLELKSVNASFARQVLADDDTKCQLNQEVEDLREAIKVLP